MSKFKLFIVLLVNLVLQATIFSRIQVFGAIPNLSIPLIIALSVLYGETVGGYSGLAIGLLEDAAFSSVLGVRALVYYLTGYLFGRWIKNTSSNVWVGAFMTAFATFVTFFFMGVILLLLRINISFMPYLKGPLFIEMLINSILYFVIFYLVRRFMRPRYMNRRY